MPSRVIKESIWTSPNLNNLSAEAERHFYRLLPCPDDHGCFECTPKVIKGKCYPLVDKVTPEIIDQLQGELEQEKLMFRWPNGNRQYAIYPKLQRHQRIRSLHQRKTPEPPKEILKKCQQLMALDGESQPLTTSDDKRQHSHPNPIPNPILILNIYTVWNEQKIIQHKKPTDDIKRAITTSLVDYSEEEICQAIRNYAEILQSDIYYFKYSWTLKDFLKRGLPKFLDLEIAKKNYTKDNKNGTHREKLGKVPQPSQFTRPDQLRH